MSQNAEEQPGTTPPLSCDATTDSTETVTQDIDIKLDISDVSVQLQPSDIIKTTTDDEPLRRSQRISKRTDNMADYLAEEGRNVKCG